MRSVFDKQFSFSYKTVFYQSNCFKWISPPPKMNFWTWLSMYKDQRNLWVHSKGWFVNIWALIHGTKNEFSKHKVLRNSWMFYSFTRYNENILEHRILKIKFPSCTGTKENSWTILLLNKEGKNLNLWVPHRVQWSKLSEHRVLRNS